MRWPFPNVRFSQRNAGLGIGIHRGCAHRDNLLDAGVMAGVNDMRIDEGVLEIGFALVAHITHDAANKSGHVKNVVGLVALEIMQHHLPVGEVAFRRMWASKFW